ncbi:MAG: hypothetical protein WD467_03190 [Candidatus Saccharimonadales bacterium]
MKVRHEASPLLAVAEIEPIQVYEGNRLVIEQGIDYPSDLDLNPVRALLLRSREFIPAVASVRLNGGRLGVRLFDYRAERNITPDKQQRMQRKLCQVFGGESGTAGQVGAAVVLGVGLNLESEDPARATVNCQLINTEYLQHEQFLISTNFRRFGFNLRMDGPDAIHLLPLGHLHFDQVSDAEQLERFRKDLTREAPAVVSFDPLV